jgi:hypothetical protein
MSGVLIQVRRDTAANWSTINPVLALGELGYDTTNKVLKVGDGTTSWNLLGIMGQQSRLSNSFTNVTVSNTQVETSLASYSISGAQANDLYRFQAWGTQYNNTGSTVSTNYLFKLGTTTLYSTQGTGSVTGTNTKQWVVDAYLAINTTSSEESWAVLNLQTNASNVQWVNSTVYVARITATEDMTSAKTWDLRCSMGVASVDAYITLEGYYVSRIR